MVRYQIGVIGYGDYDDCPKDIEPDMKVYKFAYMLGKALGEKGYVVVTGGGTGVMEEANKGCQESGGISVGVTPENERGKGNNYLDVEVVSGMNMIGESTLLVTMCDALILLGGGSGALQEVAIAYRQGKPIYSIKGLKGWSNLLEELDFLDSRRKTRIKYFKTVDNLLNELEEDLASR